MNATPQFKFITWLSDGSEYWNYQIIDSEALISLRERAQEATGGNIEVHAYPLHAHDAMREALEAVAREWERTECPLAQLGPQAPQWIQDVKAALKLAEGEVRS